MMAKVVDRAAVPKGTPEGVALVKGCMVVELPDGSAVAHVRIDPDILKRVKSRAHRQDIAEYLWLNVFRAALSAHVY